MDARVARSHGELGVCCESDRLKDDQPSEVAPKQSHDKQVRIRDISVAVPVSLLNSRTKLASNESALPQTRPRADEFMRATVHVLQSFDDVQPRALSPFLLLAIGGCGDAPVSTDLRPTSECLDLAETFCNRLASCGSAPRDGRNFVGTPECTSAYALACENARESPAMALGAAEIAACRTELEQDTCSAIRFDYHLFDLPACLRRFGLQGVGDRCTMDGHCRQDLVCEFGGCVETDDGTFPNPADRCEEPACESTPLEAGAACVGPEPGYCTGSVVDTVAVVCETSTQICIEPELRALSQGCYWGDNGGDPIWCAKGLSCQSCKSDGCTQGATCQLPLEAGARCTQDSHCSFPLQCIDDVCDLSSQSSWLTEGP